jgi:hypothetical protein
MLLEQLGLADVAAEDVGALMPGYFLRLPDAGPVPRPVEIQPDRIE